MFFSQPELNLLRTSTLLSDYIRKHLEFINAPIQLNVSPSVNQVMCGWNEEEVKVGRRLVHLNVARESYAKFQIEAEPISPESYTSGDGRLVVSCISWEEKGRKVVTSVDLILVLEFIVGELFSIEEKSRIRRNLQFLKPWTITRSGSESKRIFNSIMAMDNPRPRNIEKDLKVFDWSELFVAVEKVLSKYSANPSAPPPVQFQSIAKILSEESEKANVGQTLRKDTPLSLSSSDCAVGVCRGPSVNGHQVPTPIPINPFLDLPQHFNSPTLKFGNTRGQTNVQLERELSNYLRHNVMDQARPIQPQTIHAR